MFPSLIYLFIALNFLFAFAIHLFPPRYFIPIIQIYFLVSCLLSLNHQFSFNILYIIVLFFFFHILINSHIIATYPKLKKLSTISHNTVLFYQQTIIYLQKFINLTLRFNLHIISSNCTTFDFQHLLLIIIFPFPLSKQ